MFEGDAGGSELLNSSKNITLQRHAWRNSFLPKTKWLLSSRFLGFGKEIKLISFDSECGD